FTIIENGAVRVAGVVTVDTTVPHHIRQGAQIQISGASDPSFDGTFYVASAPVDRFSTRLTFRQAGPDATSSGGTITTMDQGRAVAGGIFYDGTQYPAGYRGNLFYTDFESARVKRAVVGPGTSVQSVDF